MNLVIELQFNDGTDSLQWGFDEMQGIPIPLIGDCVTQEHGDYRVTGRTFQYDGDTMTVFLWCEKIITEDAPANS